MTTETPKPTIKERLRAVRKAASQRAKTYRQQRPHRSFKRTKRVTTKIGGKPLPTLRHHLADTAAFAWAEKRTLLPLAAIFGVFSYFVVGGLSQIDYVAMREATLQVMGGDLNALGQAVSLFGGALSGAITAPPSTLQGFIGGFAMVVFWLATVWYARMRLAKQKVGLRDALYNCCAPLIPSLLVVAAIALQLIPALIGIFGLSIVRSNGWVQNGVEAMMIVTAVVLLCLLTLYWVCSSLLALVIVTLPKAYPWRALSAASQLVIGQRWKLATHILWLSLATVVVWAVVVVAVMLLDAWLQFDWLPIVPVTVQALTAITLVFASLYIYKLYRSLL